VCIETREANVVVSVTCTARQERGQASGYSGSVQYRGGDCDVRLLSRALCYNVLSFHKDETDSVILTGVSGHSLVVRNIFNLSSQVWGF
jgi:hypothetical protein